MPFARRRSARFAVLAQSQSTHQDPDQLDLVLLQSAHFSSSSIPLEPDRVRGGYSIAVIGLYIAYGIPILLRLIAGSRFQRGPCTWVSGVGPLASSPCCGSRSSRSCSCFHRQRQATTLRPSTTLRWPCRCPDLTRGLLVLSAKNWFKGPKVQGSAEELAKIEAELSARARLPQRGGRRLIPVVSDKPRIGITVHPRRGMEYYVPYRRAVEAAGAEPVDLGPRDKALPELDGLLLPGGWDVDPSSMESDETRRSGRPIPSWMRPSCRFFRQAREASLPVLGICRGQQVINVALVARSCSISNDHDPAPSPDPPRSYHRGRSVIGAWTRRRRAQDPRHSSITRREDPRPGSCRQPERRRNGRRSRVRRRPYRLRCSATRGADHRPAMGATTLRAIRRQGSRPPQKPVSDPLLTKDQLAAASRPAIRHRRCRLHRYAGPAHGQRVDADTSLKRHTKANPPKAANYLLAA